MHSTTIAKLLAKENIDIQYGNYKTAWFDVRNRILGLPMWGDIAKDTNDLFVCHEVGHALYTPEDGWHESEKKISGAPRSYINVTEDARIERFIKRDYPGAIAPMRRGYVNLVEDGFFGEATDYTTEDFKDVKLIDKINLKAKLGIAIEVPFNDEEQVFMDRAMTTQTFEEVVELARDILIYTQDNQEELLTPPPELPEGMEYQDESGESQEGPQGHDDYEMPDSQGEVEEETKVGQTPTDEDSDDESSEETESKNSGSGDSEEEEETDLEESEASSFVPVPKQSDIEESATDSASKEYEREKANPSAYDKRNPRIMRFEVSKDEMDGIVIPYKVLAEDRAKTRSEYKDYEGAGFSYNKDQSYSGRDIGIMDGYDEYIAKVKKASYYAVKEFEMRKAAFQWQRAQTAKSGTLDMNKIHAYKYNEDIFARVTHLADAKNHGMIMLVDLSGSMYDTLYAVIDQIFHLAAFCKMTAIPFDVYGFTTGGQEDQQAFHRDGSVVLERLYMPQLLSSTLKSSDYNQALKELYMKYRAYSSCSSSWTGDYSETGYFDYNSIDSQYEILGSTPLNTSLMVTHKLIKKFRMKHGIDKMNLIVLSDGDTNGVYTHNNRNLGDNQASTSFQDVKLLVENKWINSNGNGVGMTKALLENINKRYGCTTLGFFIGSNPYDFKSKIRQIEDDFHYDYNEINKEYRKNKCITKTNVLGYNEFYLVKSGKSLEAGDDGFTVDEDASTAKIRTAFKKSANSKKKNKVLLTNFGKAVA